MHRKIRFLGLGSVVVGALACNDFDTERAVPKRASVGEEVYGVLCDRVGGQALREDLIGASFRAVCHRTNGKFADKVDQTKLPALSAGGKDAKGIPVPLDKQRASRAYAVARIEALARRRDDLIEALDASFPDVLVPIKDVKNPDPRKSCAAPAKSGEGRLPSELADVLARFTPLYLDGTLPQSTESLAKVVNAFRDSEEAQTAWARLGARKGYRPNEVGLGALRPIMAYPRLRDLANSSLSVLSADSRPYETTGSGGVEVHIPVPGVANAQFNKVLEVAQKEMRHMKADPVAAPLASSADPAIGRNVISRPRDNLEIMSTVLLSSDPAFGGGSPRYIVRRDSRGYAALAGLAGPPFVDRDGDRLADVDDFGQFVTSNGSVAPSPFYYPGTELQTPRDPFGRAVVGDKLLYSYVDTSRSFAGQMMADMKPLMNPDASQNHETIMDMLAGAYVAMGPREQRARREYPDGAVEYDRIKAQDSPLLDLAYAMLVILGDKNADEVLQLTRSLFIDKQAELARVIGAVLTAKETSNASKFDTAKIPAKSVFWDEMLDVIAKIAKEPGLLEDIMLAMANEKTAQLGAAMSRFANYRDRITYDRNNINGPAYNDTAKAVTEMKTPVDRGQKLTGDNRSALQRFLQAVADADGVTMCNRPGGKAHAKLGIQITLPTDFILGPFEDSEDWRNGYRECRALKIDSMAQFYLGGISGLPGKGAIYLRDGVMRDGVLGIGATAATVSLIEDASALRGFWTPADSRELRPKPAWLNRLVHFDHVNDTNNPKSKLFIGDLNGTHIGSAICPERLIPDPCRGNSGCGNGAKVASDGMVHGLRSCKEGEWFEQRNKDALFVLENFGFYDAIQPTVAAFAGHNREDLFVELSSIINKHFPNADASAAECQIGVGKSCVRDDIVSYEPLLTEIFSQDVLPALVALTKELTTMVFKQCTAVDAKTGLCTKSGTMTGVQVLAAATRSTVLPDAAKASGLKDRRGNADALRNDGTKNPQVTPAYLLTNALSAIDKSFEDWQAAHPEDTERLTRWRRARSQLADQFLAVTGKGTSSRFANPSLPKLTPIIVDLLRSQLFARCPTSFTPPYEPCKWAREDLPKRMQDSLGGPLFASMMDLGDAMRKDEPGRRELETLMQYLLDEASKNDALQAMLASSTDIVQILQDERNIVPFMHVMAEAMAPTKKDASGNVIDKGLVDAQSALLAKLSGRALDKDGVELCSKEIDPNQVITVALGKLVTPLPEGPQKGKAPLEVIIDVIADVNRGDPTKSPEDKLDNADYKNISENVSDFLLNKERGMEQFYEVIRNGVK